MLTEVLGGTSITEVYVTIISDAENIPKWDKTFPILNIITLSFKKFPKPSENFFFFKKVVTILGFLAKPSHRSAANYSTLVVLSKSGKHKSRQMGVAMFKLIYQTGR